MVDLTEPAGGRAFKDHVLAEAREDWMGVYEVWWAANSHFPARPLSQRLAMAEQAVAELLGEGAIRLYRGSWDEPEQEQISGADAITILEDWSTWMPEDDDVIWIGAVEAHAPEGHAHGSVA
jgi:hypothetical protein